MINVDVICARQYIQTYQGTLCYRPGRAPLFVVSMALYALGDGKFNQVVEAAVARAPPAKKSYRLLKVEERRRSA